MNAKMEVIDMNTTTFTTPSLFKVTIRETNGEDEANLSRVRDSRDITRLARFLASLITEYYNPHTGETTKNPGYEEIMAWRLADKYYTIYKSRMFSLGEDLLFTYTFPKAKKSTNLTQDLKEFDRDLSEPGLTQVENMASPVLFPGDFKRSLTLKSGKILRYTFLNSSGEKNTFEKDINEVSRATEELMCRFLEYYHEPESKWYTVENFRMFSSRDMTEIRSDIKTNDINFQPEVMIMNSDGTLADSVNMLLVPDFFYPEETL